MSAEVSQTARRRDALGAKVRQAYGATTRDRQEETWIVENLPLVRRIVHRIAAHISHREDLEDLIAAGTLGLVKAARAYDAGRDAQFTTYATIRVRGAVIDELRKRSFVPAAVGNQIRTVAEAYQRHCKKHGRPPSDEQLAAEVGISEAQLYRTLEEARKRHFLSIHGVSEEESPLGALAPTGREPSPDRQAESRETAERLAKAITELPERDRKVILLYYERELTMKEIAAVLGITESRVSHLHAGALFKLSMKMRT